MLFDEPGGLANQHDAVIRVPTHYRRGMRKVSSIHAPGACPDLLMEAGKCSGRSHVDEDVSPTGFEPVRPAPEAGALSGLSYGDAIECRLYDTASL